MGGRLKAELQTSPRAARLRYVELTALGGCADTGAVARIYDLVMTHQLDADDFFIHRVQQHCAEAGLNFFLIEPLWVGAFLENLVPGKLWARVLLNMHSEHHQPDDIFHRLIRLASEKHTRMIDPPDVALAAFDKARLHPRLVAAGIRVPPSVIVAREAAGKLELMPEQRTMLGSPFVIKPSMGYGRRGLVLDATSERDLERSVAAWKNPHYLLQQKIVPRLLHGEPVYFRVYFVFGTVWLCWWNCFNDRYRKATAAEFEALGLGRLEETVRQIASLTGMNFFSSEIAITETNELVVIDYVNDQCHLLTQSASPHNGVPDDIVADIARRLVEATRSLIKG